MCYRPPITLRPRTERITYEPNKKLTKGTTADDMAKDVRGEKQFYF